MPSSSYTSFTPQPGRPPRVVLETAIVMSALMFGGGPGSRLREYWQLGYCRPLLCMTTLLDLTRTLAHPQLGLNRIEQQQLLADYLPHALKVRVPAAQRREGDDQPPALAFARLAMAGKAHVLVTGEPDMLTMQGRLSCGVMALEPFLDTLAGSGIKPQPLRPR